MGKKIISSDRNFIQPVFLLYFKYKDFFIANYNSILGTHYSIIKLVLPIGISFYTFQSISFLVDIYKKKNGHANVFGLPDVYVFLSAPHSRTNCSSYQFLATGCQKIFITKENISEGLFLISKGLIKKAIIGDFIAQYSDIVFSQPAGFSGTEHFSQHYVIPFRYFLTSAVIPIWRLVLHCY